MRCVRRMFSSTGVSSSTGNGGVSDVARRRSERTWISMSPVGRFGFTFSGARLTTSPSAETTCSGRRSSASANASPDACGWMTSCTMPAAVAQVDEDQPAVVAAAVHPAGDADLVPQRSARSSPHQASR